MVSGQTMLLVTVVVAKEDYAGFLAFLSEELLDKGHMDFNMFRYRQNLQEETEFVQLEVRNLSQKEKTTVRGRLEQLKRTGTIRDVQEGGWYLQKRMFGDKGGELARDIFDLSTRFAIETREKFGRLLDPQNEYPEEVMNRFMSPGAWLLFSCFSNALGYTPIEEINAYLTAIQTRLQLMDKKKSEDVRRMLKLVLDMM